MKLVSVDSIADCLVLIGYETEIPDYTPPDPEPEPIGYAWSSLSDDGGENWTEKTKIAESDEEQSSIKILYTGGLFAVVVSGGAIKSYLSSDYGLTWEQVTNAIS